MHHDLLQLLEYNFWANDQFIMRLKDQPNLPSKISDLMSHILSAHRIWLGRIAGRGSLPSAWDNVDQESWEGINIEVYNETTDLVKSNKLDQKISYSNSKGEHFSNELRGILYHIINHSTHHRAQIALLMRQNEILPPATDLIFYLRN